MTRAAGPSHRGQYAGVPGHHGQGFQSKYIDYLSPDSADYFLAASGGSLTGSYSLRATAPAPVPGNIVGTAGNGFLRYGRQR